MRINLAYNGLTKRLSIKCLWSWVTYSTRAMRHDILSKVQLKLRSLYSATSIVLFSTVAVDPLAVWKPKLMNVWLKPLSIWMICARSTQHKWKAKQHSFRSILGWTSSLHGWNQPCCWWQTTWGYNTFTFCYISAVPWNPLSAQLSMTWWNPLSH